MEYWIWLSQLRGIGPLVQKGLLHHFQTPKSIYESSLDELFAVTGIGHILAHRIQETRSLDLALAIVDEMHKKGIKLLTYDDPLYPGIAKEMADAPIVLYYKGHIRQNSVGVGIVGSRRCTAYGKQVAIDAAEYLAEQDIPVISGLARGIDGYAHTACLKVGGYTIAFLGHGLNISYPKEHSELLEGVVEGGLAISEHPPKVKIRPEYFPRRNALISSWSKKLLVVEAAERSGALITARYAKSQGKQIFVPPHEIYSKTGKGANQLLIEGANLYLKPSQLLLEADPMMNASISQSLKTRTKKKNSLINKNKQKLEDNLTQVELEIWNALINSPKTLGQVGKLTGIEQIELIELMSIMELEGIIEPMPGGRYSLKKHRDTGTGSLSHQIIPNREN